MSVDATKIKVGDKIRLRNGEVRTVNSCSIKVNSKYPVRVGYEEDYDRIVEYTDKGFYWSSSAADPQPEDSEDIVEIIPASEKKVDTKVNLDDLKVGDIIKLADGTMPVVTHIETIPEDDREFQKFDHRYNVTFLTEDGYEDSWDYRKDGTGESLYKEEIVEIIPSGSNSEESGSESVNDPERDDTPEDVVAVKNGLTLTEVLTYGTVGQVYGRRIDGVLQDSKYHITLHTCSLGEKIGFDLKKGIACTLEDIEASDWEFVGYKAAGWHLLI